MADIPADIKPFAGKYIARATQMDALAEKKPETGAATVAFYCRRKALAAIMDNRAAANLDNPDVANYVGALMTNTESAKSALGISPATKEADAVSVGNQLEAGSLNLPQHEKYAGRSRIHDKPRLSLCVTQLSFFIIGGLSAFSRHGWLDWAFSFRLMLLLLLPSFQAVLARLRAFFAIDCESFTMGAGKNPRICDQLVCYS
jgi:hypothetical protein